MLHISPTVTGIMNAHRIPSVHQRTESTIESLQLVHKLSFSSDCLSLQLLHLPRGRDHNSSIECSRHIVHAPMLYGVAVLCFKDCLLIINSMLHTIGCFEVPVDTSIYWERCYPKATSGNSRSWWLVLLSLLAWSSRKKSAPFVHSMAWCQAWEMAKQ
jgi:hypothetical protein